MQGMNKAIALAAFLLSYLAAGASKVVFDRSRRERNKGPAEESMRRHMNYPGTSTNIPPYAVKLEDEVALTAV